MAFTRGRKKQSATISPICDEWAELLSPTQEGLKFWSKSVSWMLGSTYVHLFALLLYTGVEQKKLIMKISDHNGPGSDWWLQVDNNHNELKKLFYDTHVFVHIDHKCLKYWPTGQTQTIVIQSIDIFYFPPDACIQLVGLIQSHCKASWDKNNRITSYSPSPVLSCMKCS